MAPDEIAAAFATDLDLSYRAGDLERIEAVYVHLGLLPPGAPLRAAMLQLLQGQVAAFYDPRQRQLVVATRATQSVGFGVAFLSLLTGFDPAGELLVAHELTHALQDQHYGIPTDPEPLTDTHSDRVLARRAVLEGDATLAGFAYVVHGRLDDQLLTRLETEVQKLPAQLAAELPNVPEVIRATLAFQYDDGMAFTVRAFKQGGWPAVDQLHRDPPLSTEQVLHPERYYGTRDPPLEIALRGTAAFERGGWHCILADTLGELDIRSLFTRVFPPARAAELAAGWGGDRLRAFEHDDELLLVWMTAWDSEADAIDFAAALPSAAPHARIERRGTRALVLLGSPGVDSDRLAANVWRETR